MGQTTCEHLAVANCWSTSVLQIENGNPSSAPATSFEHIALAAS